LPATPTLHSAAPFGKAATFHQHRGATQTSIGDAPIQSGAAVGPHAALDPMTQLRAIIHETNLRRADDSCQTIALTRLRARART
jgi:hypothetical protein